jgi:hypothetical protein
MVNLRNDMLFLIKSFFLIVMTALHGRPPLLGYDYDLLVVGRLLEGLRALEKKASQGLTPVSCNDVKEVILPLKYWASAEGLITLEAYDVFIDSDEGWCFSEHYEFLQALSQLSFSNANRARSLQTVRDLAKYVENSDANVGRPLEYEGFISKLHTLGNEIPANAYKPLSLCLLNLQELVYKVTAKHCGLVKGSLEWEDFVNKLRGLEKIDCKCGHVGSYPRCRAHSIARIEAKAFWYVEVPILLLGELYALACLQIWAYEHIDLLVKKCKRKCTNMIKLGTFKRLPNSQAIPPATK